MAMTSEDRPKPCSPEEGHYTDATGLEGRLEVSDLSLRARMEREIETAKAAEAELLDSIQRASPDVARIGQTALDHLGTRIAVFRDALTEIDQLTIKNTGLESLVGVREEELRLLSGEVQHLLDTCVPKPELAEAKAEIDQLTKERDGLREQIGRISRDHPAQATLQLHLAKAEASLVTLTARVRELEAKQGTYVHACGLAVPHTAEQCWSTVVQQNAEYRQQITELEFDVRVLRASTSQDRKDVDIEVQLLRERAEAAEAKVQRHDALIAELDRSLGAGGINDLAFHVGQVQAVLQDCEALEHEVAHLKDYVQHKAECIVNMSVSGGLVAKLDIPQCTCGLQPLPHAETK